MYSEASYEMTQGAFSSENEADKRLLVHFNLFPHLNQEKSNSAGRPIYEDKVYVTIIVPGDKDSVVHREAWEKDFKRFPRQYQNFLNKDSEAVVGTPLKLVPWLTSSQIKELEYFNLKTVEHLATVNDGVASKFHGLQALKQRANDFLEAAHKAAPMLEMRKVIEDKDAQLASMQKQLDELAKMVAKDKQESKKEKAA